MSFCSAVSARFLPTDPSLPRRRLRGRGRLPAAAAGRGFYAHESTAVRTPSLPAQRADLPRCAHTPRGARHETQLLSHPLVVEGGGALRGALSSPRTSSHSLLPPPPLSAPRSPPHPPPPLRATRKRTRVREEHNQWAAACVPCALLRAQLGTAPTCAADTRRHRTRTPTRAPPARRASYRSRVHPPTQPRGAVARKHLFASCFSRRRARPRSGGTRARTLCIAAM